MLRDIYPALALGLLVGDIVYGLMIIPEHGPVAIKLVLYTTVVAALQAKRMFRRKP